jgi:hypothetical protein
VSEEPTGVPFITMTNPKSNNDILSRISSFLPEIKAANEALEQHVDEPDEEHPSRKRRSIAVDSYLQVVKDSDTDDDSDDPDESDGSKTNESDHDNKDEDGPSKSSSSDNDNGSSSSDDGSCSTDDNETSDDSLKHHATKKKSNEQKQTIVMNLAFGKLDENPIIDMLAANSAGESDDDNTSDKKSTADDENDVYESGNKSTTKTSEFIRNVCSQKEDSDEHERKPKKAKGPLITELT